MVSKEKPQWAAFKKFDRIEPIKEKEEREQDKNAA